MTCSVIQTNKGNIARVHSEKPMSEKSQAAMERLIDAATEDMKRRRLLSPYQPPEESL